MSVRFALVQSLLDLLQKWNLNFFRIHLLWFTINPLVWSVIFYLCNGQYHVPYIDSLFLCVSAQTVTGLSPVNPSTLTGFQQAILFYLLLVGNYTITSFVMVLVRKHFFVAKVLRERPVPVGVKLARFGSRVRSKTMAVLESPITILPFGSPPPGPVQRTLQQDHPLVKVESAPEVRRGREPARHPLHETQSDYPTHPVGIMDGPGNDKETTEKKQRAPPPAPLTFGDLGQARANQNLVSSPSQLLSTSPTSISTGMAGPRSPQQTPMGDVLENPPHLSESPPAMESQVPVPQTGSSLVALHSPSLNGDSNFPYRPVRPSPLGRREIHAQTRAATRIMTPAPGPQRQGTGLFFSSTHANPNRQSMSAYGDQTNTVGVPLAHAQTAPQGEELATNAPSAATYEKGFGGFPMPLTLTGRLAKHIAPGAVEKLKRRLTINQPQAYTPGATHKTQGPVTNGADGAMLSATSVSQRDSSARSRRPQSHSDTRPQEENESFGNPAGSSVQHGPPGPIPEHLHFASRKKHRDPSPQSSAASSNDIFDDIQEGVMKTMAYMTHGVLKIGRNSAFDTHNLTQEQIEELGGVEYRALRVLSWIVGLYFVGVQLMYFIILTIFLKSTAEYDPVFAGQPRNVPKAWFSAFQAVSAYVGGGLSLVDASMVPFQDAYVMIIFQGLCTIAGNMGLPIFLRLIVWILSKIASERHQEPLKFLLEHPRRCFLYLFPSHQTWFLVVVFLILTFIEWFGFLILNIGLDVVESLPVGRRVLVGLFQSIAVRASGFGIVSVGMIAPAMKFLYMVMMYISAYPIAMSIRSTNVYEQRSLGIYEDATPEDDSDPDVDENAAKLVKGSKGEVLFSKYLGMHVRRQLSYDLWWLAAAMFLICVVERTEIMNPDNESWFNQFQIMFELVSAYATVGLSLGIPTQNYSFCGAMRPLSKIILCLVMIRGRHRDLPQAIDRAILLPHEFAQSKVDSEGRHIIGENPTCEEIKPGPTDEVAEPRKEISGAGPKEPKKNE